MTKAGTLLIFLFSIALLYGQNDFRKGYIITSGNEKNYGYINYREGTQQYNVCSFKPTENSEIIDYTPYQIKGYGYDNDKYFESKLIEKTGETSKKYFLEVLVSGKVTLYRFAMSFYVQKGEDILRKLYTESKEVFVDGKRYIIESKHHIGILSILFSDCPKVKNSIPAVRLTEKRLTELVASYNECSGEPGITYKEHKPWVKLHLGIAAGFALSDIKFEDNITYFTEIYKGSFKNHKSLITGLDIDISSPRINERISFHGGLYYTKMSFLGSEIQEGIILEHNDLFINLKQLKVPLGFRYTLPEKNLTPFINLGILNTFNLSSSFKWRQEKQSSNTVNTYEYDIGISDVKLGYWGGIGINKQIKNKLYGALELRYDRSLGANSDISRPVYKYSVSSIQLLMTIYF